MEEIIMRKVLVKKQEIEDMIGQIDKHFEVMWFLFHTLWDKISDEEAHTLDESSIPLFKCKKILQSYLK
jgi:hypothetical protein